MITMHRKVLFVTAITGLVILASSMRCENAANSQPNDVTIICSSA
jgi:hypothetical protein